MTDAQAADPRRADLGADAAGGADAVRHAAQARRAKAASILYISHKLDEIRALCHHCTVLRGGKVTGEVDPTQETNASLSRLMIGAEPPQLQHRAAHAGRGRARGARPHARQGRPVRHRARRHLVRRARRRGRRHRRRLGQRPAGADGRALGRGHGARRPDRSALRAATSRAPRRARAATRGLHFVPEERLGRGAVPTLSLAQNTLLTRTARGRRRRLDPHRRRRGAAPSR